MSSVFFGGSRSLGSSPVVSRVVAAVLTSGASVSVGCCAGADALVVSSLLRSSSFSQARVFAAFASSGAGACSLSSVASVQAFASAGGSVSWLAGGPLSVPLAARLLRRSLAALAGCSAAVFFAPGSGSLAVAGAAVQAGVPVFVLASSVAGLPVFSFPPTLPRGCPGSWVPSRFLGFACWSFQAAASQPSLF